MKRGERIFKRLSRLTGGAFKQYSLAVIAVAALGGLGLAQIRDAHRPSARPANNHEPSFSLAERPVAAKLPKKPLLKPVAPPGPEPPILSWRGPVEPVPITPDVPVLSKLPVNEPIVFVGIDDGWIQTPEALNWLTRHHLPFSLFLSDDGINNNYQYFRVLQAAGMAIQNHTLSHPKLTKLNLDQQKAEICGAADTYEKVFGHRPTLFRPPYGLFNDLTRQAVAECGMKAIIMWHASVDRGAMYFQEGTHLLPGDIVLFHFRHEFMNDMQVLIDQLERDQLKIGRLEDWLP